MAKKNNSNRKTAGRGGSSPANKPRGGTKGRGGSSARKEGKGTQK